jgi:hypothetical protein
LWYGEPDAISNAIEYPKFFSRSHHVVIRDAFKAVRRRLQDYARRQRGQVKVHNAIAPLRKDKTPFLTAPRSL